MTDLPRDLRLPGTARKALGVRQLTGAPGLGAQLGVHEHAAERVTSR